MFDADRRPSEGAGLPRALAVVAAVAAIVVGCTAASSSGPGAGGASNSATESPVAATITVRYGDGIPKQIDGRAVLRGQDVLDAAARTMTSAPFLVGVWLDVYNGPHSCPVDTTSFPPGSWLHGCPSGTSASDEAGEGSSVLAEHRTATFQFATGLVSGPAVLVVHVHDPRATVCGADEPACDRMIVVDHAIWAGDAATAPGPISVASVQRALAILEPGVPFRLGPTNEAAPTDSVSIGLAPVNGQMPGEPGPHRISGAYVLPSIDAIRRALPGVGDGVAGSTTSAAFHWGTSVMNAQGKVTYSTTARWLLVDNVALSVVLSSATPTAADRAYMQTLVDALQAAR